MKRIAPVGLLVTLSLAVACSKKEVSVVTTIRPVSSLPATTLPWLSLKDHFVATVGPSAGQGQPLGPLLVLADATFAPRSRFPLHGHREMEILSVVVEGELSHHGDQADGSVVKARGAQLISSRDGMRHAEGNETDAQTHMLQIWFEPTTHGGPAVAFARQLPSTLGVHLVAGDDGMPLRCPVKVWWVDVQGAQRLPVRARGYLVGLRGGVQVDGQKLSVGDGAVLSPGTVALDGDGAVLVIELS
ncbi:MAG: pirin family protein [Myxococcaceae bacterium]|nr:pirin family protein [Myxococcaceae bacterium]